MVVEPMVLVARAVVAKVWVGSVEVTTAMVPRAMVMALAVTMSLMAQTMVVATVAPVVWKVDPWHAVAKEVVEAMVEVVEVVEAAAEAVVGTEARPPVRLVDKTVEEGRVAGTWAEAAGMGREEAERAMA